MQLSHGDFQPLDDRVTEVSMEARSACVEIWKESWREFLSGDHGEYRSEIVIGCSRVLSDLEAKEGGGGRAERTTRILRSKSQKTGRGFSDEKQDSGRADEEQGWRDLLRRAHAWRMRLAGREVGVFCADDAPAR